MTGLRKKNKHLAIILLGVVLLIVGIKFYTVIPAQDEPVEIATLLNQERLIAPFELMDTNNQPFTNDDLLGKWSLFFFGFTNCPDICPTTLAVLGQVANTLDLDKNSLVQTIFVSVDPERDNLEKLAQYVPYFHKTFRAVTGDHEELTKLANNLGAMYLKMPASPENEDSYLVDHTGSILVVSPAGHFHAVFTSPHNAQAISQDLLAIQNNYRGEFPGPVLVKQEHKAPSQIAAREIDAATAINVSEAYVRETPPTKTVTAAFMQLRNDSSLLRKLVKVESDLTDRVELHKTSNRDGVMSMQEVENIPIYAHNREFLKPGGYHVMLFDLPGPLTHGNEVTLRLVFDDNSIAEIEVPVISVLAEQE